MPFGDCSRCTVRYTRGVEQCAHGGGQDKECMADLQGIELNGVETCMRRHRYPVTLTIRIHEQGIIVRAVDPSKCPMCNSSNPAAADPYVFLGKRE